MVEQTIPKIVEKEFKAKTLEIAQIKEGYSHSMYFVKINKHPFEIILRFTNNKREENSLEKEEFIIRTLRKNKIPAPKIYVLTKDYMILEKIQGERLDKIWDNLSAEEKYNITRKIGRMLKDIHAIKFDKFGKIKKNGEIEGDNPFTFRKEGTEIPHNKWLRILLRDSLKDYARLLSYENIDLKLMNKVNNFILNNLETIKYNGEASLIHGDFQKGHLFIRRIENEYKIVGIIDFEFADSYCPEYDFIKLHREGFFDNRKLLKALQEGYGKINKKAVEIYRLLRDIGFVQVLFDSGNKTKANEVLKSIKIRLKKY